MFTMLYVLCKCVYIWSASHETLISIHENNNMGSAYFDLFVTVNFSSLSLFSITSISTVTIFLCSSFLFV